MKLVVATTRYSTSETVRLEINSSLEQVLALLRQLGVPGWTLQGNGDCRLERDDGHLYIAIQPASSKSRKEFLRQVAESSYYDKSSVPPAILAKAAEVIGDDKRGWLWLTTYNPVLGTQPLDLLEEPDGTQRVLDALGRMEWGVYS